MLIHIITPLYHQTLWYCIKDDDHDDDDDDNDCYCLLCYCSVFIADGINKFSVFINLNEFGIHVYPWQAIIVSCI